MIKRYRISVMEVKSPSSTHISQVDVDSYFEFVEYIQSEGVQMFSLSSSSFAVDFNSYFKCGIDVKDFNQEHFDWLIYEVKDGSRYFEIDNRIKKKKAMKASRTKNFKLGTFHGKLFPEKNIREAKLRNALYLIGNLRVELAREDCFDVRILGYEVPLGERDKRIDLLGYDKYYNSWIIELKTDESTDTIDEVVNQVNDYANLFKPLIPFIKEEIKDVFLLDINLTDNIKKMVLMPRDYYVGKNVSHISKDNVLICSIARIREIYDADGNLTLTDKLGSFDRITLTIHNK